LVVRIIVTMFHLIRKGRIPLARRIQLSDNSRIFFDERPVDGVRSVKRFVSEKFIVRRTCNARRPETGNDHHRQLTRLEQSGSGYELHLILSLATNRAASVLGRDLASYRLRRGPVVHVLPS
jgi:hypothetical protein